MSRHTVFLVDDHPVLLRGLADLVAMEADFSVAGSTTRPTPETWLTLMLRSLSGRKSL